MCTDLNSENWEGNFLSELRHEEQLRVTMRNVDQESLKITTYNEAIDSLENLES